MAHPVYHREHTGTVGRRKVRYDHTVSYSGLQVKKIGQQNEQAWYYETNMLHIIVLCVLCFRLCTVFYLYQFLRIACVCRVILTIYLLTYTHPFNGLFSGTTRVSRYQKGKTNLDFTAARDSEWQWHQLGHMQVCNSLQTDNHASTPPLSLLQVGCPSCRPTNSVKASKHRRHN